MYDNWMESVINETEVRKFAGDRDFIDDERIETILAENRKPEKRRVRDIIQKSLAIERLNPDETAALLNVEDRQLLDEIFKAAGEVKKKVYDNRIVTFAPLYLSNYCVNSCLYCGFRKENTKEKRRRLSAGEVRKETEALVQTGHKRLIVVYGEHPLSDIDYICETIQTIYSVKNGNGEIRRVNVNASPMSIEKLKMLKEAGIGTYQVFQETYHHETYKKVHPAGIKSNYQWRLYALHRAQEAGIDDVAIGALFGLYDWRFEVMGLVYHTIDLEKHFGGIGPHTISFPRMEPAENAPLALNPPYKVSDDDFKKLIAVLRLSVPYTGMIITAREPAHIRRESLGLGITAVSSGRHKNSRRGNRRICGFGLHHFFLHRRLQMRQDWSVHNGTFEKRKRKMVLQTERSFDIPRVAGRLRYGRNKTKRRKNHSKGNFRDKTESP